MADERHALAAALRQLPGVHGVGFEVGPSGESLRLRLGHAVRAAEVVDAVSEVLRARLGHDVGVDVSIDEEAPGQSAPEQRGGPGAAEDASHDRPPSEASDDDVGDEHTAVASDSILETVVLPGERDGGRRPALVRVQTRRRGLDVTAVVTLDVSRPGDERPTRVSGTATGAATPSGSHRAVASATLRAIESLVGGALGGVRLEAETVAVVNLGAGRMAAVAVELLSGLGGERYTGAAEVRTEVGDAFVRATLDAVNRRLEQLLAAVEAEHLGRS